MPGGACLVQAAVQGACFVDNRHRLERFGGRQWVFIVLCGNHLIRIHWRCNSCAQPVCRHVTGSLHRLPLRPHFFSFDLASNSCFQAIGP